MTGPRKIEKDHYLFREGDAPDAMYIIKSGKLAVVKSKQNSEIILAEKGVGGMIGEMAFFDNKPRSASVKALKDSEVIALPYKALHAQFQNFPEWCKAIMRTVNEHLRDANQRIKQLEKAETDGELFPPHTITKLVSILSFVGMRYGKNSPEDGGIVIDGHRLRNYTIQVFQEATHKMDKLLMVFEGLNLAKSIDLGEGRKKIIIFQADLLFQFVEWYNEWLFKKESDRIVVKEEELKLVNGVLHFAKKAPKDEKGMAKLDLTHMQNESMKELGYLIRVEETAGLSEKKLIGDHMMQEGSVSAFVNVEELEKTAPFWNIVYQLKKITR